MIVLRFRSEESCVDFAFDGPDRGCCKRDQCKGRRGSAEWFLPRVGYMALLLVKEGTMGGDLPWQSFQRRREGAQSFIRLQFLFALGVQDSPYVTFPVSMHTHQKLPTPKEGWSLSPSPSLSP